MENFIVSFIFEKKNNTIVPFQMSDLMSYFYDIYVEMRFVYLGIRHQNEKINFINSFIRMAIYAFGFFFCTF
jgi:hypothetical protein